MHQAIAADPVRVRGRKRIGSLRRAIRSCGRGWLAAGSLLVGACQGEREVAPRGDPESLGPRVLDERLELSLFASEPNIVTPIGIAVDGEDRIFVLESHTHTRPSDYAGPPGDRVLILRDVDGDGVVDSRSVFAEGIEQGMNLAFSPDGVLYVVAARGVWALYDVDGDGVSEAREQVVEMREPQSVWPHAALLAITFSPDGWMYLSRGNTGGQAYTLVGSDGSRVSGYGDGGNVIRARPDGSELREYATGFWNGFALGFDRDGRLLLVDNDPDSRGPNRVVHVIDGGDYGYRALFGGSGIHPYLAWNGELPGTLPYAAAVGEAPAGLLFAGAGALPTDYAGEAMVTIWEESRIDRIRFSPRGVSVVGEAEPVIQGDETFRPVAMAADSRGTVYITDWVRREYLNHGRGRIWRLRTREGEATLRPEKGLAGSRPDPAGEPLRRIYAAESPDELPRLREALRSDDPFLRSAAGTVLARPVFRAAAVEATWDPDARVRIGAMLALRRAEFEGEAIVRRLLSDPSAEVRRTALIWAGSSGMLALRPELARVLAEGEVTPALFEVYLATVEQLTPEFDSAYRTRAAPSAGQLRRELPEGFVAALVRDATLPAELRAIALVHLDGSGEAEALLVELARSAADPSLRVEAVRSLAYLATAMAGSTLLGIARDEAQPLALRAEALTGLSRQPTDGTGAVLELLEDTDPDVRLEALRHLRTRALDDAARARITRAHEASGGTEGDPVGEQFAVLLGLPQSRPESLSEWEARLGERPGDPTRGSRVFHSVQSTCAQCHAMSGRGGTLGPDLTNVGRSKTRRGLIQSILEPSAEISPEYQGWYVRTPDGRLHEGRQIDVGRTSVELYVGGEFVEFADFTGYGTLDRSLMPDGLENNLTVSEMRDLIAWLEADRSETDTLRGSRR